MRLFSLYWLTGLAFLMGCNLKNDTAGFDVIILGSGTGAVAAAIQSGRSGAQTALIHPLPWYGGMLTSAGVSATDGNHYLPAGLWGEFRDSLYSYYGGPDSVRTGWVSLTLFEPSVGAQIFDEMIAATPNLTVYPEASWSHIKRGGEKWKVKISNANEQKTLSGKILIDGTDLGDVAAAVGAGFEIGMDAQAITNEMWAPEEGNAIIQDLTYVAILKEYPVGEAPQVEQPEGYDPSEFACACAYNCPDTTVVSCQQMLNYGKLPNRKYMINWPNFGNDYYVNPVVLSSEERLEEYQKAKDQTLRFVYYIQNELGFSNLGLADDEFPTNDRLAFYPYHREGRRVKGLVRTTLNHIANPYDETPPLYRTGIAVGDYPVDHHHDKYVDVPELEFPPVPSFNIPVGSLISKDIPNLLMADKAISVSNLANGSTRLQPVILQVGQAAGLIGALAVQENTSPDRLDVRSIQQELLEIGGYLMPFYDVLKDDPHFMAIQRVGSTGLLRGLGEPYLWANRTWFYPDSTLDVSDWIMGMQSFKSGYRPASVIDRIHRKDARDFLLLTAEGLGLSSQKIPKLSDWNQEVVQLGNSFTGWADQPAKPILRREWAVLLDAFLDPFQELPVVTSSLK